MLPRAVALCPAALGRDTNTIAICDAMGGGIPGVKQASIDQLEPAVLREGVCFRREPIDWYEPGGNPGRWSQARRNMLATPDCSKLVRLRGGRGGLKRECAEAARELAAASTDA